MNGALNTVRGKYRRENSIIWQPRNGHWISDIARTILSYVPYKKPSHRTFCLINRKPNLCNI